MPERPKTVIPITPICLDSSMIFHGFKIPISSALAATATAHAVHQKDCDQLPRVSESTLSNPLPLPILPEASHRPGVVDS